MAKLPPGSVMEATLAGRPIAVCNAGGDLYAVDGTCPHSGGPLAQGALHDHTLVCPWHAWEYDCRTGALLFNPSVQLQTFAVKVQGDDIFIDAGD